MRKYGELKSRRDFFAHGILFKITNGTEIIGEQGWELGRQKPGQFYLKLTLGARNSWDKVGTQ